MFTPLNQKRLTNVAYVRLKRKGKRFELACYRNKVVNWRSGVETDIDEVLQIDSIFVNVSRGEVASKKELSKAFGIDDKQEIIRIILRDGQLQVSDLERKAELESLSRDIATIISQKCVNPQTNRPYPFTVIARMLKTAHFSPSTTRTAKQQALEILPELQQHLPIERAKMLIKLQVAASDAQMMKDWLHENEIVPKTENSNEEKCNIECEIPPAMYRQLDAMVQKMPNVSLTVLCAAVFEEGSTSVNNEMARLGLNPSDNQGSMFGFHSDARTHTAAASSPRAISALPATAGSGADASGLKCSTAPGEVFASRDELLKHYKTDWHNYNVQRKATGMPVMAKAEFETMSPDEREESLNKETTDSSSSRAKKEVSNSTNAKQKKPSKKKQAKKAKHKAKLQAQAANDPIADADAAAEAEAEADFDAEFFK